MMLYFLPTAVNFSAWKRLNGTNMTPQNAISLNGPWTLYHFPEGEIAIQHPDELAACGLTGLLALVPGNVELDLERAGVIPDPFYGDHIRQLRPLETHEWWLVRKFHAAKMAEVQRWDLVFEGLDTLATIWMNGIAVGRSDNMLVEQRFDVSSQLRDGENEIAVRLGSVLNAARRFNYDASSMSWERREEGLYVRKAAHVWGWDILPRAVSAGIWKPVRIEPAAEDEIEQLYFWTREVHAGSALLGVRFQFRTAAAELDGLELQFHGECGGHTFDFTWPVEFISGGCTISIANARLWWPRGYGEPNLYRVTTRLLRRGQTLAERVDRVGVRKLVVDRTELAGHAYQAPQLSILPGRYDTDPDPTSHFVVTVNDVPVMVKGSNWVPLDAFHSRDSQRLERSLALAVELGCNCLRCWGGGVYGEDRFFDLCDENGILVWQDFAFACCRYPQDETFLARVRIEAEAVVRRLRNHACLALYCGDNEIDMSYLSDGLLPVHNRITREVLPQVVHRLDPFRHYVPSSPYAPPEISPGPNAWEHTPEQHLWGPRGYFKGDFYTQHSAHFIGEIGYHGCPNAESIRKFISPQHIWPWQDNDEWQVHAVYHWQQRAVPRDRILLMANQIRAFFGEIPETLDAFVFASQATQAEAKKFFIESTRVRKWSTSGILWWNVIDGWPQFSDAVVDYYFAKKLAFEIIRRAQLPLGLVVGEAGANGLHPLVLCNDTHSDADLTWRVWDAESRAVLSEGVQGVPANQNWQVAAIPATLGPRLMVLEWQAGGQSFHSHYLEAVPPVSLAWYRRLFEELIAPLV
jgi:beta-mannosidase